MQTLQTRRAAGIVLDSALSAPSSRDIHRGHLFRKYLLLILSLVMAVLLASGAISLYFSYQENKAALASLQQEKAIGAASRIEQYIQQLTEQLTFASLPQFDGMDLETRRTEFLRLLRQVPEVTDVAHLDVAGREQVEVSRLGMDSMGSGRDRSTEAAFRNPGLGAPWFGPVYFNKGSEPYMTIAIRSAGDLGSVTVAELNLKFIWEVVSRITIGDKGKAYVVDSSGLLVADPDLDLVLRKTSLAALPHVSAAAAATFPGAEAMVTRNLRGAQVLASFAPIKPLGWNVFVEQPIAEVYAKLNASILRTALLLLAGLLVSAVAAWMLARNMVRPIRTLNEGARRIGTGELDARIVVKTGDELEALADQFNRMSAQLRESYGELERKVEQRTVELTASLASQTAAAEILKVVSHSPADLQPVLQAIAERSVLRCDADASKIWLQEGDHFRAVTGYQAGKGARPGGEDILPVNAGSVVGRAFVEGRTLHVEDVARLADGGQAPAPRVHQRDDVGTVLAVPMVREGRSIGVIAVLRRKVKAFSDAEVRLVETFAEQAVIAIQNVRLFREIEDKGRELEVANRHKSEFLANMSHELRTPLNAIIGFSEVLTERMFGDVNDKQMEYLQDIHSSGLHLLTLINDVLDLSKIEAGRMELEPSSIDIGQLMGNALTLVRERAQRDGILISLDVGDGLTQWVADARKLKQVVVNLLANAVKFTPSGGRVQLTARRVGTAAQSAAEFTVADTGVGIPAEDQALVFDEFRQGSSSHPRKAEGTGLGLALVKRFVELHGGTIRVESRAGEGTRFVFVLPLLVPEAVL